MPVLPYTYVDKCIFSKFWDILFIVIDFCCALHITTPPPPNTIRVKMYIHDMIQFVFELIPVKVKKDKVTYFSMNSFNLLYFQE